jgi:hypothetical protein
MYCAEHPGIKFGDVAKTASELWKQLDESERMRCGLLLCTHNQADLFLDESLEGAGLVTRQLLLCFLGHND